MTTASILSDIVIVWAAVCIVTSIIFVVVFRERDPWEGGE